MSQPIAKKRKTETTTTNETTITDARFANIQSDPRYRLPGRKQKIKVDKRFAKALQDEDFSRKAKVDRYGRPLENDSERNRLKRKYEFAEEDEDHELESDEADDDDEVQAELKRVTESRDVLREGKDVSSSEDESSSDEETDVEEDNDGLEDQVSEGIPGARDQDVPMGEISPRLAVVNLDWDNIRAEDLMAVFQSFLPASGHLLKVVIYPSEFGRERMEREEMEGPPKEIFARKNEDSTSESEPEDDEDIKKSILKPDDGSEFDSTALRQYQLERLRYYYAILTFSDAQTAKAIYDAVDGTEYLSTANFFDLRFVPDDTNFSDERPREECEHIPSGYKPTEFVTDALQHSKVKLTWDADDTTRKEVQARAFRRGRKDIEEDDLKAYLATDSEVSEQEEEVVEAATSAVSKKDAERQRMRALLGLAPEPVKKSKDKKATPLGNIQVTFSSGLAGLADDAEDTSDENSMVSKPKKKHNVFENSPEPDETTMEKYVRKEKERKQRRKEKMKANRNDTANEIGDTQTSQPITTEADQTSDQEMGFDDPFFAEPTHDAKSTSKLRKADRLKRRAEREAEEAASAQQRKELETFMADDNDARKGRTVVHFDMNEIEKAEKAASKSKKNKKQLKHRKEGGSSTVRDHEAVLANDTFEINTQDPRFASLYSNHEFAIDPSNPRYKDTRGMKTLLEEGRKMKGKEVKGDGKKDKKSTAGAGAGADATSEVMGLVDKIKRRTR